MLGRRLVLPLAVLAFAAPAAAAAEDVADLDTGSCHTGLALADRSMAFSGEMRALHGASTMQMRFTLQQRSGRGWKVVPAPGFGAWQTADPGIARFVVNKRVVGLIAPARYRALARFRWRDEGGTTIHFERAVSESCLQPDLRPNLVAEAIRTESAGDGTTRYAIPVRNTGASTAGPFDVLLTVNGTPRPALAVAELAPKDRRVVTIDGPSCAQGTDVVVRVDAAGAVDERDEDDNVVSLSCA